MAFVHIIPALRTPFGVDFFDYQLDPKYTPLPGTLIPIPFRNHIIPGLVREQAAESLFRHKVKSISKPSFEIEFPPKILPLLQATAKQTFSSEASILHAWIRQSPKRIHPGVPSQRSSRQTTIHQPISSQWTSRRVEEILKAARTAKGRVLIVTPWKERAASLAQTLQTTFLDGDVPTKEAWERWNLFLQSPEITLVTTRIGAWLSICADCVIIDEPENDDHRQDELAPRFDARWIVQTAKELRPDIAALNIGTTPPLQTPESEWKQACSIPGSIIYETWTRGSFSKIPNLTERTLKIIEETLPTSRPILIFHPIPGDQRRIRCADCQWLAVCSACDFPLLRDSTQSICRLCRRRFEIPALCPNCQGTNFAKGGTGFTHVKRKLAEYFGERNKIDVFDTGHWNRLKIPMHSLIIVTNLTLISDAGEDIRRTEKLVITWRRLAAAAHATDSQLIVQGTESMLQDASAWLTQEGIEKIWGKEYKQRKDFGYPPAKRIIKLLIDHTFEESTLLKEELKITLGLLWNVSDPFPVLYRSKTRRIRHVIHLSPPENLNSEQVIHCLQPFAKKAIIDLDPIALLR